MICEFFFQKKKKKICGFCLELRINLNNKYGSIVGKHDKKLKCENSKHCACIGLILATKVGLIILPNSTIFYSFLCLTHIHKYTFL